LPRAELALEWCGCCLHFCSSSFTTIRTGIFHKTSLLATKKLWQWQSHLAWTSQTGKQTFIHCTKVPNATYYEETMNPNKKRLKIPLNNCYAATSY